MLKTTELSTLKNVRKTGRQCKEEERAETSEMKRRGLEIEAMENGPCRGATSVQDKKRCLSGEDDKSHQSGSRQQDSEKEKDLRQKKSAIEPPVFTCVKEELGVKAGDIVALKALHTGTAVCECVEGLEAARSHSQVVAWLSRLMLTLHCCAPGMNSDPGSSNSSSNNSSSNSMGTRVDWKAFQRCVHVHVYTLYIHACMHNMLQGLPWLVNPRRACTGGLQYLSCVSVCVSYPYSSKLSNKASYQSG